MYTYIYEEHNFQSDVVDKKGNPKWWVNFIVFEENGLLLEVECKGPKKFKQKIKELEKKCGEFGDIVTEFKFLAEKEGWE